jgi:hypothetical protein
MSETYTNSVEKHAVTLLSDAAKEELDCLVSIRDNLKHERQENISKVYSYMLAIDAIYTVIQGHE